MPINEGQIWLSHLVTMCMKCTFFMLNDKQETLIFTYYYVGETSCIPSTTCIEFSAEGVYHLLMSVVHATIQKDYS